jgi:DNA helicase-2/ATP-dependent DNA helicase PcrA
MILNEQQKKVIAHTDGPCVVVSVPGSGKTSTITERFISLVNKGVNTSRILCITFTNKSGNELKERICKKLNTKKVNSFIGTFHAFSALVLRHYGDRIGYKPNYTIFDSQDQKDFVIKIVRQLGIEKDDPSIKIDKIIQGVNFSRENCETESQMQERFKDNPIWFDVSKKYLEEIRKINVLDFTGLLSETVRLLEENEEVKEKMQNRFSYIMVDECQDTNILQFKLINILAAKHRNTMLIGDLSQSLYLFRNARCENILDFINENKDCVQIPLEKNYRSTPEIVKVADTLINHNTSHLKVKFETDNPSGSPINCGKFRFPEDEALSLAKTIKHYIYNEKYLGKDIAVIYRLNRLSLELQQVFSREGIPFTVYGGPSFFDRKEIRDCVAMIRFLVNRSDNLAFHRVASILDGIGAGTINELEEMAKERELTIFDMAKIVPQVTDKVKVNKLAQTIIDVFDFNYLGMSPGDVVTRLVEKMKYLDSLDKEYGLDSLDRKDNIVELINNATVFGENKAKDIEKYIQNIMLVTSSDQENKENNVTLMTSHTSKGLEFPIVFVVGIESAIMPHSLAISEAKDPEKVLEEERRILYVSMTRAKKHLYLSYCEFRKIRDNKGMVKNIKVWPSPFLVEAGVLDKNEIKKI